MVICSSSHCIWCYVRYHVRNRLRHYLQDRLRHYLQYHLQYGLLHHLQNLLPYHLVHICNHIFIAFHTPLPMVTASSVIVELAVTKLSSSLSRTDPDRLRTLSVSLHKPIDKRVTVYCLGCNFAITYLANFHNSFGLSFLLNQ